MEAKAKYYGIIANNVIEKLRIRGMEGYYAATREDALALVKEKFLTAGTSVAWGGSVTLDEVGIMDYLKESGCVLYDRSQAKTPEEQRELKSKIVNADVFMMSTNAITLDGELVNIDGRGNRLGFLVYGPEKVLVVTGMNKLVTNVEEGIHRVQNMASPPNTVRLGKKTPCAETGRCGNCHADDCICSQIVITRHCMEKNRIQVVLVGEELGF